MSTPRQPDFLGPRNTLRTLQAATASVIVLCAVLIFGLFAGYADPERRQAAIGDIENSSDTTPASSSAQGRLPKPLGTIAVNSLAPGLEADTVRYYEETTGRSFSSNLRTGRTATLSDRRLSGFVRSWWVPGNPEVISAFEERGSAVYRYYDYATQRVEVIPGSVVSLAVSPDGRNIATANTGDGILSVAIHSTDGTDPHTILTSRTESPELLWPAPDMLILASKRSDRSGTDLTAVSTDGDLLPFMTNRESLEFVWSRDGRYLLFSYFVPGSGIRLWYRDMSTGVEVPLGLVTGARKCAWHPAGVAVTCGIPSKTSLVNGVSSAMTATLDDIVTLDIAGGKEHRDYVARQGVFLGVIDPLVSSSGNYFVFTNLFDKKAYSLEL